MNFDVSQNKTIIILAAVLLAVVIGSAVVLLVIPDTPNTTFTESVPAQKTGGDDTTDVSPADSEQPDIRVIQSQAYQLLNKQLVREGALPVKPPNVVGKANPFR